MVRSCGTPLLRSPTHLGIATTYWFPRMGLNLGSSSRKNYQYIYNVYAVRSREIVVVGNLSIVLTACRPVLLSKASVKSGGRASIILLSF
jgi:hypothetical protein